MLQLGKLCKDKSTESNGQNQLIPKEILLQGNAGTVLLEIQWPPVPADKPAAHSRAMAVIHTAVQYAVI